MLRKFGITSDFVHNTGSITTMPKDEELLYPAETETVDEVDVEQGVIVVEEVIEASLAKTIPVVDEAVEEVKLLM